MRVAILIITLILGAIMFMQTIVGGMLGAVAQSEAIQDAAAMGVFVALLWLIAAAFVISWPMVSVTSFGLASLVAFSVSDVYGDMAVWGGLSLGLAVFSFLGYLGKRRQRKRQATLEAEQRARDERLEALLTQQQRASSQ